MSDQATNPKQSEKPAWMLASSADDSKAGSGTPAPASAASATPAKPAAPAANAAPMTVAERARAAALAAQQARAGGAAPTPAAPAADKPAAPKPAAAPVSAPAPAANTAGMSVAERARAAAKAAQTAREGGAPVVSAPAPVTTAAPAPTPVAKPAAPVAASTAGMSVAERARAAAKAAQSGGSPAPVAKPAPTAAAAPAPAPKPVATAPKPAAPVGGAAAIAMPARPAPAPAKREEPVYVPPGGVTRREFLNYIWGASMALLLAESAVLTYLFSFPRFRAGDFGGKIAVGVSEFPQLNGNPAPNNVGKFWMVSTEKGVMTHYKICTHLGCIYGWDESAKIFSCPCHGSQFQYDGTYRAGPAPRGLDRFSFEVVDATDKVLVESKDGTAIDLKKYPDAAKILVNTGNKITGIARA